jgi:dTDP-4-amino-4,6-dideoxygalactose transaminase
MRERIYLSPPHMGGREEELVQEAFRTNWISPAGPHIAAFEKEISAQAGVTASCALSSGTAAIHLALKVLGVSPGDEVLCSTFTFIGSISPVIYQGATPVFVDSEADTWNMDPDLLEKAIVEGLQRGRKPKAIIVVHLYGMPAAIDRIMGLSKKYDIPVVEDAAEAVGSMFNDIKLGAWGDVGIYSFNGNKIITTSGGGALLSADEKLVDQVRFLATQARDPAVHYQHSTIGFNYRLSNVCAAIGRGQLGVLEQRVSARRKVFEYYAEKLSPLGIRFLKEQPGSFSNRWLTTILLDPKKVSPLEVVQALEKENIECRPLWKPMHLQPVFDSSSRSYINGVSESLYGSGVCLPSGSAMTESQQELVVSSITSLFDR